MKNPVITLTTDFGYKDPYTGIMKGVILGINPEATLVDLTHSINRHDVREAAMVIASSYRYFPSGTIHIVIADPGVGSGRRPVLVASGNHYFIGPDNGVFSCIYDENPECRVIHLTRQHYFLKRISPTFHGRDIFAPVAAWLSKGLELSSLGDEVKDYVRQQIPCPLKEGSAIRGEIILIDHFGNAVTNIRINDIEDMRNFRVEGRIKIMINGNEAQLLHYYSQAQDNSLYTIEGSMGFIEFFVFGKDASSAYGLRIGDSVRVSFA
ncbi:MAG: SAM-dependent chlorinase/fluorinase [Nitrospirota bacterium]